MSETRAVHDPFLGKTVEVSNRLTDRLRGKYASGPTLPNGEPEFGWRQFETPPIQHEAADTIEALVKALTAMLDQFGGYCGAPGCDEAIAVMQTLGLDRWSMQSQMERSAINQNVPQPSDCVGQTRGSS